MGMAPPTDDGSARASDRPRSVTAMPSCRHRPSRWHGLPRLRAASVSSEDTDDLVLAPAQGSQLVVEHRSLVLGR